jgi:hypothetical protein
LFDASYTSLDDIRARLHVNEEFLYAGPYVISNLPPDAPAWGSKHHLNAIKDRIKAIEAREDETGRLKLPDGHLHALRNALFHGKDVADGLLRELLGRYCKKGLKDLCESSTPPSLYRDHNGKFETRFLDALTSAPFWSDARSTNTKEETSHG